MNKGFWIPRDGEHSKDGNPSRDKPSRLDPKRSHQWFTDASEPDLFPSKKQAVEASNSRSATEMPNTNAFPWDSNFLAAPTQFVDSLFSETHNHSNLSPTGPDVFNLQKDSINMQYGNGSPVGLSIYHSIEDPDSSCINYGRSRQVKVGQVKDSNPRFSEHRSEISVGQAGNLPNQSSFISLGQYRNKEDENIMLMGHTYRGNSKVKSLNPGFGNGDDDGIQIGHCYSKEDTTNTIFFGASSEEPDVHVSAQPINSCGKIYNESAVQAPETCDNDGVGISTDCAIASMPPPVPKRKSESGTKNKSEPKGAKKEIPNSFPSNVRSLMSTGMLDGVPVKYVSAREELHGVIQGSGYLCGCPNCNKSTKALNAYEFERHAGRKTKHPNNHIFFQNGKTIYQIVQELKSTPESELFDVMQTITGSPLNQKAFCIWKESFQAAARVLHRIYGKEDINV